jgi:hypothetical protein
VTLTEAKELLTELLIEWPNVNGWLNKYSPDARATLAKWQQTWLDVPYCDIWHVLDSLTSGDLEMLPQYDIGRLHIWIKKHAQDLQRERAGLWQRLQARKPEPEPDREPDREPLPRGFLRKEYQLSLSAAERFPGPGNVDRRREFIATRLRKAGFAEVLEQLK